MRRRRLLSLVTAASLFSGCSTTSPPGSANSRSGETTSPSPESILAERDSPSREALPTAERPPAEEPPEATEDTVSPRAYPSKPPEYTAGSVRTFVESHERAYRCNDSLARWGTTLVSHGSSFDWTVTLDANGDAGIARCKYTYSDTTSEDGDTTITDSPTNVVTYYVDDSMIVRARPVGSAGRREELRPDPWESGVVLEPAE